MNVSEVINMIQWENRVFKSNIHVVRYLAASSGLHINLVEMLYNRDISNEDDLFKYLYPELTDLHDPFLLNDLKMALYRIVKAIQSGEHIMIYGDYDVDGITSTTLLLKGLLFFKAKANFTLPTRKDGYGLSKAAIEKMCEEEVSLIITVDNGSNAHAALALAKKYGIDVIVTDHHEIMGQHPDCYAFVNPKRSDNTYPNPHLAGVGVAFKLVQGLFLVSNRNDWNRHVWAYLELASLGTIADLMPLQGENRVIAKLGISRMNTQPSPPIKCLLKLLKISSVTSTDVSFLLSPIFNSSGRIDDPNAAVTFLIDDHTSVEEANRFIQLNQIRKQMTTEQFALLDSHVIAHNLHNNRVIVAMDNLHEGIIGILAAKLSEKYRKPSIVITNEGKGSARSVQNTDFSIVSAIERCAEHLKTFGGHRAAAGLSIDINKLTLFDEALQKSAELEAPIRSVSYFDFETSLSDFSSNLFTDMNDLEPYGIGNPKPKFLSRGIFPDQIKYFGNHEQNATLHFSKHKAMLFNKADTLKTNSNLLFDFLYSPNCYIKRDYIVEDFRFV